MGENQAGLACRSSRGSREWVCHLWSDDAWIPSACSLCYGTCSILADRQDGVLVKIEGNPDSAVGKGRLCGKGVSGLMTHYDPNRVRVPLRGTNPLKGIGVDPGWKEISWEAARSLRGCGSSATLPRAKGFSSTISSR